ncbi:MAG: NarK/NasA family nitrate transporter [Nitrospira sp.]|nr:NarK/NasA family nitrate transporter [Nitrospira sp.]
MKGVLQALRSGHWPTLLGAWLHFEISFMVWLLIGSMGIAISEEFSLSALQKGILVGIPLLGGAALRIVVGPLGDRLGPKVVGMGILGLEGIGLLFGWLGGTTFEAMLGIGLFLGFAGASFAIALPLASQAYPSKHQGLAMGIAGIGNSGVLLATFMAPRLAEQVGWHQVFGIMLIPVMGTALLFLWLIQSAPVRNEPTSTKQDGIVGLLRKGLQDPFMYWLCFLYGVTFGGFVGLSSYLPIFLHDQFHVGMVNAGTLTALCALAGSCARPFGGFLADRFGGLVLLQGLFFVTAILCLASGNLEHFALAFIIIFLIMVCLGFGNGAIFQVVFYRFKSMMGTASGFIGAAGGIGGFLLPSGFGWLKEITGTFSAGFFVLGLVSGLAGISVMMFQRSIRLTKHKSIREI